MVKKKAPRVDRAEVERILANPGLVKTAKELAKVPEMAACLSIAQNSEASQAEAAQLLQLLHGDSMLKFRAHVKNHPPSADVIGFLLLAHEGLVRKKDGEKGGPKPKFSTQEIIKFRANWERIQGHKRGSLKAASLYFETSESNLKKRLPKKSGT